MILDEFITTILEYSGGIIVTKVTKIDRIDAVIDEISQRI